MPKGIRKPVTHFVICLDRSSSMAPFSKRVVDTFNQNVEAIRSAAKKHYQRATVSLVSFADTVQTHYLCEDVEKLQALQYGEYKPYGNTALFDAVGLTTDKLWNERKDRKFKYVSFMFIIITDGQENHSKSYHSPVDMLEVMRKTQSTDRWSYAFLTPPGYAGIFCRQFGVPAGNVREWEQTDKGASVAAQAIDMGITNYVQLRSQGLTSTRGFFTTDLSKVDANQVQRKLQDIRDRVIVLKVPRETPIKPFVEAETKREYERGKAYYQLTKDELIQSHKQVMLKEKGKDAIYAGADARHLLGLRDADQKVRPGNHANWDIFVQSTSVNRLLVRGTLLLVER